MTGTGTGTVAAPLIVFDDGEGRFGPLVDLRPAFALRTGAMTNAERLAARFGPIAAMRTAPALAESIAESGRGAATLPAGERFLLVNGRVCDASGFDAPAPGEAILSGTTLVAANVGRSEAARFLAEGAFEPVRTSNLDVPMIGSPWELLDRLEACIRVDAERFERDADRLGFLRLPDPDRARIGAHPILLHRTATIAPHAVFDASQGPIVVGERAVVRPLSVLVGPCAIGSGSIVAERALIKANTTCGPHCRLGGEVGGSSIAGYSNKAHDGHLGDAVVGEWVNLGAGTDNSNLLNTYGEVSVRLEPDGPRLRTGRRFFGSVIGDHVKCAIGTRLMTGTVLGTGSMIALTPPPPTTVRRFAWLTDEGERRYNLAKFLVVAETVLARRGHELSPASRRRLEALHAATEAA